MISQSDDEILNRVKARVEAGATRHRKVMAVEEDALIRAAVAWREIAREMALEVLEYRRLAEESMEVSADPMRDDGHPSA